MKQTVKYEKRRVEIATELKALHAAIGDNDPTDEQQKKWDALKAEDAKCLAAIKREEDLAEFERTTTQATVVDAPVAPARVLGTRAEKDPAWGFEAPRQFIMAMMENREARSREDLTDERLRPLAVQASDGLAIMLPRAYTPGKLLGAAGSDEHQTGDFGYGGALVQPTLLPGEMSLGFEGDPTMGRTQDVPMQTSKVAVLARTDKNHSTSVSGGLTVARRDETASITASRQEREKILLEAQGLFGLVYETEELLEDSPVTFAALVEAGFRDEFPAAILNEKLNGTGGNQYQGAVGAPCTLSVTRTTTGLFKGRDASNMLARLWRSSGGIWLANQTVRPQMAQLHIPVPSEATPTNIVSVFQPSLSPGLPDMLLGLPVYYTEFCKALGTVGDVVLANWSQFLEGMYTPLRSAESIHVRFLNHERAFKFWVRNCGAPWWRSALTPKNGDTLSPFVTLAT